MNKSDGKSIIERAHEAVDACEVYARAAKHVVLARVTSDGKFDNNLLQNEQRAVHGFAWIETTISALRSLAEWAGAIEARGDLGEPDLLALQIGFGEYLEQLVGALPMGQNEIVRPRDLDIVDEAARLSENTAVAFFMTNGNTAQNRKALTECFLNGKELCEATGDETLEAIRLEYRRFTEQRIVPFAHQWHLDNALIPDEVVKEMADLGTFGVCIPEEHGGLGLGKLVMCVVTEELSRGWIGTGSLGTRSEIAGELILAGGLDHQKDHWLPKIASGEVLPTAVFTEPDVGSDLGALKTRATQTENGWSISGSKTWITHAARSDMMTLLARTDKETPGYAGLSMFLAPKPRGTEADPFPAQGMSGTEIEVLGYRGMREYELGFDDFHVDEGSLLGGEGGFGFKQLMATFEGARIQTAARAVGVARRALEVSLAYARERKQFGKSIIAFPRVHDKIAMMAVDVLMAREVTYFSAREKDKGRRCDIEAGMAKLFAARAAWANADSGLQIHGGNGYALEYEISRLLCDARILNIFEGAAEIQAQVVAKGKLSERN